MREISTKKIEIGEHLLLDGVEYVAEKGTCCVCAFGESKCDYAPFCPINVKLTRVEKQPNEEQEAGNAQE